MPPSARGSTHAYAYAGTSTGVTVGPDDSVNGSSDNCIDVNTDGSSDVRIGSASFRGPAYGVINVRVAGGIIVNVSTYVHDYGATNTRPAGSADTSAHTGPECSRDVSTDDNFGTSTARGLRCYFVGFSASGVVHGGANAQVIDSRGGSLYATIDGSTDARYDDSFDACTASGLTHDQTGHDGGVAVSIDGSSDTSIDASTDAKTDGCPHDSTASARITHVTTNHRYDARPVCCHGIDAVPTIDSIDSVRTHTSVYIAVHARVANARHAHNHPRVSPGHVPRCSAPSA